MNRMHRAHIFMVPKTGIQKKRMKIFWIFARNCLIWINELTIKVICKINHRLILHNREYPHTACLVCDAAYNGIFGDNDPKSKECSIVREIACDFNLPKIQWQFIVSEKCLQHWIVSAYSMDNRRLFE